MAHAWGYGTANGPATWENVAPNAKGKRQSPIDIKSSQADFDQGLKDSPLRIHYDPSKAKQVDNNGHSVMMVYDSDGSMLTGGPMHQEHRVAQFHFHWGRTSSTGSEHRVDGHMYAAEAHIVHYNADVYKDFASAAAAGDGLCVLGAFIKAGKEHAGFKQLSDMVQHVPYSGDSVKVTGGYDPSLLLPENRKDYWTYPGSLTTPPCYESVTWVVFKEPLEFSEEQLNELRALKSVHQGEAAQDELEGKMVENYRPPLPLGDRKLRASFS